MGGDRTKGLIEKVKGIADEARSLVDELQPKAQANAELTKAQLGRISKLVARAEATMSEANERAKAARKTEIEELEGLIKSVTTALGTPGLSNSARKELQDLRRRRRAQLLNLQTREALDFGGILSATQIQEIADVLKRAKQDVARKKKAAGFVASLMRIADIAVGIVRKASGVP